MRRDHIEAAASMVCVALFAYLVALQIWAWL